MRRVAGTGRVAPSARPRARAGTLAGFGSPFHLAARFFGALSPAGPPPEDTRWAHERLSPGERELFSRMSGPDRRHAVGVARESLRLAGEDGLAEDELPGGFVAAGLLHDVGKVESRLGTFGRVAATVLTIVLGRSRVERLGGSGRGPLAEVARYLAHDRIGARLLEQAGSAELTIRWSREHHLPASRWQTEPQLASYLKEADGD